MISRQRMGRDGMCSLIERRRGHLFLRYGRYHAPGAGTKRFPLPYRSGRKTLYHRGYSQTDRNRSVHPANRDGRFAGGPAHRMVPGRIAHLLTPNSGIPHYTDTPAYWKEVAVDVPKERILDYEKAYPLAFEPGSPWGIQQHGVLFPRAGDGSRFGNRIY